MSARKFSIGLTGGIGSGKSTVADLFATRGVPIVDTDVIAHRITAPGGIAMPAIAHEFGPSFIAPDGSLDRAAMRSLIFSDDSAKGRLEAITHPLIRAETARARQEARGILHSVPHSPLHSPLHSPHRSPHRSPYHIVVVPLLVESGVWKNRVDRVLVVDCAIETQIARVMRRNAFTREQVLAIIANQATREARLAAADDVIVNENAPIEALDMQVSELHRQYLAFAGA